MRDRERELEAARAAAGSPEASQEALQREMAERHYEGFFLQLDRLDCDARFTGPKGKVADPAPLLRQGLVEMDAFLRKGKWEKAVAVAWQLYKLPSYAPEADTQS